jgi:hypothetical protein
MRTPLSLENERTPHPTQMADNNQAMMDIITRAKPLYPATVEHLRQGQRTLLSALDSPAEVDAYIIKQMRGGYAVG